MSDGRPTFYLLRCDAVGAQLAVAKAIRALRDGYGLLVGARLSVEINEWLNGQPIDFEVGLAHFTEGSPHIVIVDKIEDIAA